MSEFILRETVGMVLEGWNISPELRKFLETAYFANVEGEELTIENAPIGTKAPSFSGGHWVRTYAGWKWNTGSIFPMPGGDWNGELIAPDEPTAQALLVNLKSASDLNVKKHWSSALADDIIESEKNGY